MFDTKENIIARLVKERTTLEEKKTHTLRAIYNKFLEITNFDSALRMQIDQFSGDYKILYAMFRTSASYLSNYANILLGSQASIGSDWANIYQACENNRSLFEEINDVIKRENICFDLNDKNTYEFLKAINNFNKLNSEYRNLLYQYRKNNERLNWVNANITKIWNLDKNNHDIISYQEEKYNSGCKRADAIFYENELEDNIIDDLNVHFDDDRKTNLFFKEKAREAIELISEIESDEIKIKFYKQLQSAINDFKNNGGGYKTTFENIIVDSKCSALGTKMKSISIGVPENGRQKDNIILFNRIKDLEESSESVDMEIKKLINENPALKDVAIDFKVNPIYDPRGKNFVYLYDKLTYFRQMVERYKEEQARKNPVFDVHKQLTPANILGAGNSLNQTNNYINTQGNGRQ